MAVLYAPGSLAVAVTGHGIAVLGDGVDAGAAAEVWRAVADGRGLGGVLDALTRAFGGSLDALPPFALAVDEGAATRVVVRGPITMSVESAGGTHELSGAGVTTWNERAIAGVRSLAIGQADAVPTLPVADGVVLAAAVRWTPGTPAAHPAPPVAAPEPAPAPPVQPEPVPELEPVPEPAPEPEFEPVPEPEPEPAPAPTVPPTMPPPAMLIDSAAVKSMADTLLPEDSTSAVPTASDHGDTVIGVRATARAEQASADAAGETVVRDDLAPAHGDHDGATISVAEARRLREAGIPGDSEPAPLAPPRPPAPGRLRLSTGQVLRMDRTVVVGRRPRATRVSGTDLPHLVAVDSPQQDVSRSHLELRVEGDSIVATDLRTTNGTTLRRPGADPVQLHPGEATVVVPGDVLDLGDGITVAVEDPA